MLRAVEFDVELEAPADMVLTEMEWELWVGGQTLWPPYYFRALLLDPTQLETLDDQGKYESRIKMIRY